MPEEGIEPSHLAVHDFVYFERSVLEAGIEPALPKEYDFESYASTNSATPAHYFRSNVAAQQCRNTVAPTNSATPASSSLLNYW